MSSPWTRAAPTPARQSTRRFSQTTESRRRSARIIVTSKQTVLTGPFFAPLIQLNLATVLSTSLPTFALARRLAVTRTQILRWFSKGGSMIPGHFQTKNWDRASQRSSYLLKDKKMRKYSFSYETNSFSEMHGTNVWQLWGSGGRRLLVF